MREILFRGKTEQGEWVYGSYVKNEWSYGLYNNPIINIEYYIYTKNTFTVDIFNTIKKQVIPETVGQFTGLTDKNGKKIFEGDIVKWDEKEWGRPYNELVEFDYDLLAMRKSDYEQWCEVIGNKWDNPELLGE